MVESRQAIERLRSFIPQHKLGHHLAQRWTVFESVA
jgi:hypothetical protein